MHLLMHCHLHLQLTRLHFLLHHKNIYLDPQLSRKTGRLDVQVHPSFAGSRGFRVLEGIQNNAAGFWCSSDDVHCFLSC